MDLVQGAPLVADVPFATINGRPYQFRFVRSHDGYDCPFIEKFYDTKDGRKFTMVGFYPNMERRWSEFLNVPATQAAVAEAVSKWSAQELEDTVTAHGLVGGYVRTKEEWLAMEVGAALSLAPVVKITKIADGEPVPWTENPAHPLSGIRVLSNTHEIMGPIMGMTLASKGADALQVTDPAEYFHQAVILNCLPGVRQASIDLNDDADKGTFHRLAMDADVFVENFRTTGKLAQENFVEDDLVPGHRGLIYVKGHGVSFDGMPWTERGCFDPLSTPWTGVCAMEGGSPNNPKYPFGNLLNDGMTGLCAVPAILEALKRRATEGGSYKVETSLCRTAMWCMDVGTFDETPDVELPNPRMMEINGPIGKMVRPASAVRYSETEDRHPQTLSYRGADPAVWLDR